MIAPAITRYSKAFHEAFENFINFSILNFNSANKMLSVIGRKYRATVTETYRPLIPIKHSNSSFIPGGGMKYPNSIPDGNGRKVPLSVKRAYDFDYTIMQQGRPFGPQVRVYGKIEHDDGCVHIVHITYPAGVNGWVPQFVGFFRTRIGLAELVP